VFLWQAVLLSGFAEAVIRTACILHPDGLPSWCLSRPSLAASITALSPSGALRYHFAPLCSSLTRFITERFLKRARKLGTDAFSRLVSAPLIKVALIT
jgi:hypothetical protein